VLAATPFHGEGYRNVRARLAHRGLAAGGKRVLRLARVHHPRAPRRLGPPNGDLAHADTPTTTRLDEMWGTDASRLYTAKDGWCSFFSAIDHSVVELAHRKDPRSLGGARAAAAGRSPRVRPPREGCRPRTPDPL